jgi:predicted deacylase
VARKNRAPFELGGKTIEPGTRKTIDLPISLLSDHTPVSLSVRVSHGRRDGPTLIISAAIHGDEVNGVEIIRRVLRHSSVRRLSGTLIAVPIVNVYGFLTNTRYLPDRRDLNRSFPGSPKGSLASRLAHLFMTEIVARSTHGIDLHTAAIHRENFPQIRCDLSNAGARNMALHFGVPVVLNSTILDGSLRQAAIAENVPFLVYEAGEALRFDEVAIRAGVKGVLRVMHHLGMISQQRRDEAPADPVISRSSSWVRAPEGGIFRPRVKLGIRVVKGDQLGIIASPFGESEFLIESPSDGIVIGRNNLPNVNEGDAIFNIASVDDPETAEEAIDIYQDDWEQNE